MSKFYEEVIFEYPRIEKKKNWKRDVYFRFRVVKRKVQGIDRKFFDIREYIVNNEGSYFTDSGLSLSPEEIDKLISYLNSARKEYFSGTGDRDRSSDTVSTQEKK